MERRQMPWELFIGVVLGSALSFASQAATDHRQARRDDRNREAATRQSESDRIRVSQKAVTGVLLLEVNEIFDAATLVAIDRSQDLETPDDVLARLRASSFRVRAHSFQIADQAVGESLRGWCTVLANQYAGRKGPDLVKFNLMFHLMQDTASRFGQHLGLIWQDLDRDGVSFRQLPPLLRVAEMTNAAVEIVSNPDGTTENVEVHNTDGGENRDE